MFITGEKNVYNLSAEALYKFEILFGGFCQIYKKGLFASQVESILEKIHKENQSKVIQNIEAYPVLYIIDRSIDLVTPMLT